jgi:hypothetical protein
VQVIGHIYHGFRIGTKTGDIIQIIKISSHILVLMEIVNPHSGPSITVWWKQ